MSRGLNISYLFILLFLNCNTTYIKKNICDSNIIINKVIELKKFKNSIHDKDRSQNENLLKLLKENVIYENGEYSEFGDLRKFVADSIINDVFNRFEFENFISQLENSSQNIKCKNNIQILSTPINNKFNSETKITFTLSKPVFCRNKPYAIIMYSYGNLVYDIGGSGVVLFKKINNQWVFIAEFWSTMT